MLGAKLSNVKKGMMTGIAALAVSLTSGCAGNTDNVYRYQHGHRVNAGGQMYQVNVEGDQYGETTQAIPLTPKSNQQVQQGYGGGDGGPMPPTPSRQGVQWGYYPYPKQGIVPMGRTTQPNLPRIVR